MKRRTPLFLSLAFLASLQAFAAQPTGKPRVKPSPRPSGITAVHPLKPIKRGVQTKPKTALKAVALSPLGKKPKPVEPTSFVVESVAGGAYRVRFVTTDPKWVLNPPGTLVLQLNADAPLAVDPAIVTWAQWPKTGGALPIKINGPHPSKAFHVYGKAAYEVCDSATGAGASSKSGSGASSPTKKCRKLVREIYSAVK
jgi:hypothetical protein